MNDESEVYPYMRAGPHISNGDLQGGPVTNKERDKFMDHLDKDVEEKEFFNTIDKEVEEQGGKKFDGEKPMMDLLDPLALEQIAKAMTYGAKKYDAHNWRKGITTSRLTAALLRHLFSFMNGVDHDEESGLPHLAHVGACWMMLTNMWLTRKDLDDRYNRSKDTE